VQKVDLYRVQYLTGCFEKVNTQSIALKVLKKYYAKKNMSDSIHSIRHEDIRIDFDSEIQDLAQLQIKAWKDAYDADIEWCWDSTMTTDDPNTAAWAVVHGKGESTNVHSHETEDNYIAGAQVSSAFWVQCPPDSGDFVFMYKTNPYTTELHEIQPKVGHFAMFDSTIQHYVTKNFTDQLRIVISMNFKFSDK
jgi:hypothetical protein|tara:strand:+ start:465 stop:1043 length:579 start_codon:yes stop_codon:yes gene_type:complete